MYCQGHPWVLVEKKTRAVPTGRRRHSYTSARYATPLFYQPEIKSDDSVIFHLFHWVPKNEPSYSTDTTSIIPWRAKRDSCVAPRGPQRNHPTKKRTRTLGRGPLGCKRRTRPLQRPGIVVTYSNVFYSGFPHKREGLCTLTDDNASGVLFFLAQQLVFCHSMAD